MKDNKGSRSKRSLMVINLIQTPAGYSVIEGTELLNKVSNQTQVPAHSQLQVTATAPVSLQVTSQAIKQPPKMTVKRKQLLSIENNLLFLKSSTNFNSKDNASQISKAPKISIEQCRSYATWFNFEEVTEIQKAQITQWLKQQGNEKLLDEKNVESCFEKYKHHRNIIIEIYYANYAPKQQYMSASAVRKFICQDAKWLMKIHVFLTSWGIINSTKINFDNENTSTSQLFLLQKSGQYDVLNLDSAYYARNSKRNTQETEAQNYQTLKKITSNIRPYCDYCGVHCEIVWFQHIRVMDPKQITSIMKNVNSKNPPLSQKQYEIVLCTKCYCNGNFPLLLTHHDFRKVSVNDRLQPGKKKKLNKHKRKQKKRKIKEQKQMLEQQQQYKQQMEQIQQQGNKKQKQRQKQKQEQEQENQNQQDIEKDEQNKDRKNGSNPTNGNKQVKITPVIQNKVPQQPQKQPNINQVIQQIVTSVKKQRIWSFEETKKLLQLVEKYSDDWDTIHKNMIKSGFCYDCQPQDMLLHFVKLPLMNISALVQHNSDQCFISQNPTQYKSQFYLKKIQRNFDNSVKLSNMIKQKNIQLNSRPVKPWKQTFDKFVNLHILKISQKIDILTELNRRSIFEQRKYEEATKQITEQ